MTLNFNINHLFTRRSRLKLASAAPASLPLRQHPKWKAFLVLVNNMILNGNPSLHPRFLELLDQADLL